MHQSLLRHRLRSSHLRARGLAVAAALLAVILIAGCGGSAHRSQVASLPSSGHAHAVRTSATAAGADQGVPDPDGRPRQGLDENGQGQLEALYAPFYHCVYDEHHVVSKQHAGAYSASLRRATSACIRLEPLPPWPLDPSNPGSRAFIGRTVTCMREKGYDATAVLNPGYIINAPEWQVVYQPGTDNVSERVAAIQYRCQDRAQRESS